MADQVLVTGVTGFIAGHVTLRLLQEGYGVRGTLRSAARADRIRQTMGDNGADAGRLTFVETDLGSDEGWGEAARNCRYVMHIASPFPMAQPRDRNALVPEARDGTLRVLDAAKAAGCERTVQTSSMVAMMYRPRRPAVFTVRENDWSDPSWTALSAYIVSKTRAEQAAWEWAKQNAFEDRLTVINPGFVLGPTLDGETGTSLDVIALLLRGAYPALPPAYLPVVDVRDLAELHVRAMTAQDAGGRRLIAAADTISIPEMAALLRDAFPAYRRRIPRLTMPGCAIRMLANLDPALRSVVPDIGARPRAEAGYVTDLTGVSFRPAAEAVRAAAQSLIDFEVV